jgi:hypothetical protein
LADSGHWDLSIFRLDIRHIDLPNVDDPTVIEAYENAIALQFEDISQVNYNSLFSLLEKY